MKRRKAIQTITLGVSGLGILNYCTSISSIPPLLEEKDQNIVSLLTEAILPSKSTEFPTPETRIQFILNQIGGVLTSDELEFYKLGLSIFKVLVEKTFLKPYEQLESDIQNYTVLRALGHPGELGFFMQKNKEWSLSHFTTSERYMTEFSKYEFLPNRHLGCTPV
tara:strand:- start:987 stop:1481 length:495 start_codon:yes stop_codon:yes gene_type:complete